MIDGSLLQKSFLENQSKKETMTSIDDINQTKRISFLLI